MTREETRHRVLSAVDRALSHTWLVPKDDQDLLQVLRSIALADDALIDQIGAGLAALPRREGEMTPAPKTFDWKKWKDLLAPYGPVAAQFLLALVALLAGQTPVQTVPSVVVGCDDAKALLDCAIHCHCCGLARDIQARQCLDDVPCPTPAP